MKLKQTETGKIFSGWKECALGDLVTFQRGHDLSKAEFKYGQYPIIGSNGIIGYHNEFTTKGPGVTIGRSGNIGGSFFHENDFWAHNTTLYVKEFHDCYPKFIYYLLKNIDLTGHNSGSAVPSLNRNFIHPVRVFVPVSIDVQRNISKILSDIDERIDLNFQINKTLESIAQAFFEQWIIDDKKNLVSMKLGDILETIESGSRPKGGIDPNLLEGVPSIGAENIDGIGFYDYSKTKFISPEFFNQMNRGIVKDYDVLIYKDGAYIGRKSMFGNGFPFIQCCVNEHVFILRTNSRANQFVLYFLLNQEDLKKLNTNSAQPGLNQASMKSLKISVLNKAKADQFEQLVKPLIDKIFFNCNQSRSLAQIRDSLLPKLMSGTIKIREL